MTGPVGYQLASVPATNIDRRTLVPLTGVEKTALVRSHVSPVTRMRIIGIEEQDGPGRT